jgi:uncharacterized protein (TIGR00369 family)
LGEFAMSTETAFKPAHDNYESVVRASFGRQGLLGGIGAWLVDVKPGHVIIELPYSAKVTQQQGLFHGAAIGAIGDSAGGYAALSLMPDGSEVVSIEYKINFVRPAKGQLLRAEGHVLRAGKSVSVSRIDVFALEQDASGQGKPVLIAVLQATFMRLDTKPKSTG